MTTYTLTPSPWLQFTDSLTGALCSNGTVTTYAAGSSSTLIATYADSVGTLNPQPVPLDSLGRGTIYLLPGTFYKCVVKDQLGNVVRTQDFIEGAADANAAPAAGTAGYDILQIEFLLG